MKRDLMKRTVIRIALVAISATALAVPGAGHAAGNLVPNPSFEQSPTDPAGNAIKQPVLPTGWIFEGAAGLFDHSQENAFNPPRSGKRMAAISIPASTTRRICQLDTCVQSPLNLVKDNTAMVYSVTPFWRTASAIPVSAGKKYSFSVYSSHSLATGSVGGAITKIRWVNSLGAPIEEDAGPSNIQQPGDADETTWELTGPKTMTAPTGAAGAIVMLGAADDLFITQVRFDDVNFSAL